MKVHVYPADDQGCGHHRLIWPVEALRKQGHDVQVVPPSDRRLEIEINQQTEDVVSVNIPGGVDVVVFQRITHKWLARAVTYLRTRGLAVIIDIDDDLSAIDPNNLAWQSLHPTNERRGVTDKRGEPYRHSWEHLVTACKTATMVTATTPELLRRYAPHGRARLLPNYLSHHYFEVEHVDSDVIGWPAAIQSHPNDPHVVGPAIRRLVDEGADFRVISHPAGAGRAFGLADDPPGRIVPLLEWPAALATELGIGITPLADTRFNKSKSWLKPLELSAVGVPWVGSPRAEYLKLHRLGCGMMCDRPKDWYRVLRALRVNEARRKELSEAGREVAAGLRLDDHAWKWWEAWTDALNLQRASKIV